MSLSSEVKAMVRTNVTMSQVVLQEQRLARNLAHVEKLRNTQIETNGEYLTERDILLYQDIKRWDEEVEDAKKNVAAWKTELAICRSQFFSEEEVAQLKEEGVLAATLNELERGDASKIPYMLEKHGADFIKQAKWAIKDRYFWNGLCPW